MNNVLLKNIAPLLSLFIFVLGNGFSSTYIASVLTHQDVSPFWIGLMTTSLYAGLVLGSFRIEKLIVRIAHIRSYAAFASLITVLMLLNGVFINVYVWLVIRFLTGFAVAGVFVVIESWLLAHATENTRGQVLSFYMVTFYASQAISQLFLKYDSDNVLLFFVFIAMSSSLSVLPLAMTTADMPSFSEPSTLRLSKIYKKCASGLYACFTGGLVLGCVYGLFPFTFVKLFHDNDLVALYMFTIILGGMLFQYPIGKLSDVIERRIVLIVISSTCILLLLLMGIFINERMLSLVFAALFGGVAFTIYPVSISHACDALSSKDIVSGIQTLLLSYSIGAMLGPVIAAKFMGESLWGIFCFLAAVCFLLVLFLSWRKTVKEDVKQEESFITYPQVTPISSEIDPRNEQTING